MTVVSKATAEADLIALAARWLDAQTELDKAAILAEVTGFTPGINPVTRRQRWATVVSQTEILADVDNGFAAQPGYFVWPDEDYHPSAQDVDQLEYEALRDRADALAALLTPTLHLVRAS